MSSTRRARGQANTSNIFSLQRTRPGVQYASMKKITLASMLALALTGCLSAMFKPKEEHGQRQEGTAALYPNAPQVWDRYLYGDAAGAQPGDRLVYERGDGSRLSLTFLSRDARGFLVEVEDTKSAPGVSAWRVEGGRVVTAFYSEEPFAQFKAQEVIQAPAGVVLTGMEALPAGAQWSETAGTFDASGTALATRERTWRVEDESGFEQSGKEIWSAGAPALYAGGNGMGLVSRETPTGSIRLVELTREASPRVPRPR